METIFEWHLVIHFVETSIAFMFRLNTFERKCIYILQWNNLTHKFSLPPHWNTIQLETIKWKAVQMQYLVACTKKCSTEIITSCSMIDTQIQWHSPLLPFFIFAKWKRTLDCWTGVAAVSEHNSYLTGTREWDEEQNRATLQKTQRTSQTQRRQ